MPSPPFEVHLVDGTYELFRHHFAVPSHLDDDGINERLAGLRGLLTAAEAATVWSAFDACAGSLSGEFIAEWQACV